jgi:ferric-dicitrate binding protein FerR (iron transport regulator)
LLFSTAKGQKKQITLSDGTTIVLNAGSSLHTDKDFGTENRTVYLSGEALFDVTHNADLPFVVHVADYDIKVLGTLFNVKAYPGEKTSETALLRGKVQILKKDGGDLTLVPNQKVVFRNIGKATVQADSAKSTAATLSVQKIVPVHFSSKDSAVIETAWAQNRLEIVNEHFADMKEKLERWYNVKIVFKDAEVGRYTFTATFENENIQQVLQALQYAYHFNYKIQGGEIMISK